MKDIIKYIIENIDIVFSLISVFVSLIVFIISLVKYKGDLKKVFNDKLIIVMNEILPKFIISAEKNFTEGSKKYEFVFRSVVSYLSSLFNLEGEVIKDKYGLLIDEKIEDFLSTPQKKEVSNGIEKNEKVSRS